MKVGIIGGSGYTGGELLRILSMHPKVEVTAVTSRKYEGRAIAEVHPNLKGIVDLKFEGMDGGEVAKKSDLVFTATPHGASMEVVPDLLYEGVKVIDLSGDFRFRDVGTYEAYYGKGHSCPEITGIYGLPELHREKIKRARLIANPGCYPITAILGAAPALKAGLIEADRIVVDSKSGVSGAGAEPKESTHFPLASESVLAYNARSHRHMPEMEQELRLIDGKARVAFVPHLVPVIRGLTSTIHCFLKKGMEGGELRKVYAEFYREEPFVRVLEAGRTPRLSAVRGSNYCDIGCFEVDEERGRCTIVTAIDNLVKGASGNAVQNLNIVAGFDERTGLASPGIHP